MDVVDDAALGSLVFVGAVVAAAADIGFSVGVAVDLVASGTTVSETSEAVAEAEVAADTVVTVTETVAAVEVSSVIASSYDVTTEEVVTKV